MNPTTVVTFLATLLLLGAATSVGALLRTGPRQVLRAEATPVAAVVAVGAMAASLYLSEVAGYAPCELCWYQRIAMYPLAILTVGAAVRRDRSVATYIQLIAAIGFIIAAYHVQLQAFPDQQSLCELTNPCTESPTKAFGAITIPQMSALSFAGIFLLTTLSPANRTESSHPHGQPTAHPSPT